MLGTCITCLRRTTSPSPLILLINTPAECFFYIVCSVFLFFFPYVEKFRIDKNGEQIKSAVVLVSCLRMKCVCILNCLGAHCTYSVPPAESTACCNRVSQVKSTESESALSFFIFIFAPSSLSHTTIRLIIQMLRHSNWKHFAASLIWKFDLVSFQVALLLTLPDSAG